MDVSFPSHSRLRWCSAPFVEPSEGKAGIHYISRGHHGQNYSAAIPR